MSKRIDFYTISLYQNDNIVDYPVISLFKKIEASIVGKSADIVRRVDNKMIRAFSYYTHPTKKQFVIPFGKLKDKNKPYWINEENKLEEIPASLYDINSLGYDVDYNVMMLTTNREGPNAQIIEEYLNTFIPKFLALKVKIEPIIHNTGIEKVRNAELVKNVTLTLDLGQSLNRFYTRQIKDNRAAALAAAFQNIAEAAKEDGDSKMLSLTLGLGKHGKREDTLNLDSLLYLLEQINIGEEFVTEITVNYKNGTQEPMSIARLKRTELILFYYCTCVGTQVSPEALLNNINGAVTDKVVIITRHNGKYFAERRAYEGEEFDIVKKWDNNK